MPVPAGPQHRDLLHQPIEQNLQQWGDTELLMIIEDRATSVEVQYNFFNNSFDYVVRVMSDAFALHG